MDPEAKLAVAEHRLAAYRTLIIAFSGGADSSLALHLAVQHCARHTEKRVFAWYCHHYTTPIEAPRAAVLGSAFTAAAELLGDRFASLTHHADINTIARRLGYSWEHAASVLRRKHLIRLHNRFGGQSKTAVITGHTLSDYYETVALRREREIPASGMPLLTPVDIYSGFVRPLFDLTRDEVRQLVKKLNLTYFDDPANRDTSLPRNRIRATQQKTRAPEPAQIADLPELQAVHARELHLDSEDWAKLGQAERARLQYTAFRRLATVKKFTRNDFQRASRLPFVLPPFFSHRENSMIVFRRGLGVSVALPPATEGPYIRGNAARRGMTIAMPYGQKSVMKLFSEQKLSPRERRRKILYFDAHNPQRIKSIV